MSTPTPPATTADTDGNGENGEAETVEETRSADSEEGQEPVSFIEQARQYRVPFEPSTLPAVIWEAAQLMRMGAKKKVSGVLLMPEFVNRIIWIVGKAGAQVTSRESVTINAEWDNLRRQTAAYVAALCDLSLLELDFHDPNGAAVTTASKYVIASIAGPLTSKDQGGSFVSDKGKLYLNFCQVLAPESVPGCDANEFAPNLYAGHCEFLGDGNDYWRCHCAEEHVELLRLFKEAIDERARMASTANSPAPTVTPAAAPAAPSDNAPAISAPASTTPSRTRQPKTRGKAYTEADKELMAYVAAIVIQGDEARAGITYGDQRNLALLDRLTISEADCRRCAEVMYSLISGLYSDGPCAWRNKSENYRRLSWQAGRPDIAGPSDGEQALIARFSAGVKRYLRARNRPKKPKSS